jgi:hypothetical protein
VGAEAVLVALQSQPEGLSSEEAAERLRRHGPNTLPEARHRLVALRFLAQFNNGLIYFLLAAAVAASILGHRVDALVIVAVLAINAVVGFVQEAKAERALAAIRSMISPRAAVWRDRRRSSATAAESFPGTSSSSRPATAFRRICASSGAQPADRRGDAHRRPACRRPHKARTRAKRSFKNGVLGETWVETGEAPDWQRLYDRRELWPIGPDVDESLARLPRPGEGLRAVQRDALPVPRRAVDDRLWRGAGRPEALRSPPPPRRSPSRRGWPCSDGTSRSPNAPCCS